MRSSTILFIFTCFITSCMSWTHKQAMDLFESQRDMAVMFEYKIDSYLKPTSAVKLLEKKETKPGVVEYSFEEKHAKLFRPSNEKCRFILVVNKKTRTVIDWRYNGNPNYCTANPWSNLLTHITIGSSSPANNAGWDLANRSAPYPNR